MKELTDAVRRFLQARSWDDLPPADISKSISIEAAELLEHFQWKNLTANDINSNEAILEGITSEISDVVIYCIEMCIILNIDIKRSILKKIEIIENKYPPELMRKSQQNSEAANDEYYRIKKSFRDFDRE